MWNNILPILTEKKMTYTLLNIGHGSTVAADEVIAILSPNSAPMKRLREEAKDEKRLIDGHPWPQIKIDYHLEKQSHCSFRFPDGNHLTAICHVN